jgi:hypothetical protein
VNPPGGSVWMPMSFGMAIDLLGVESGPMALKRKSGRATEIRGCRSRQKSRHSW